MYIFYFLIKHFSPNFYFVLFKLILQNDDRERPKEDHDNFFSSSLKKKRKKKGLNLRYSVIKNPRRQKIIMVNKLINIQGSSNSSKPTIIKKSQN